MSKKTISNQNPSNTINGLDLATTITSLQTQTTNITSNLNTITTILTGDQSEIDAIENLLTGVPTLAGTNAFTSVNTFSLNPKTSSVASQNDDIPNKLYVDNQNATKVALTGDQTIAGIKSFTGSVIVPNPTNTNQATSKTYVDTADNLKANLANPTFTGTANIPTLNVTTAVTLPTASIADNALSLNIPRLNGTNTFTITPRNNGTITNTTDLTTKSYVDTADNLKANLANPTFTGTVTTTNLTATGAVTLPTASIADTTLSTNIPKLNSTNVFTTTPQSSGTVTNSTDLTTKTYVDTANNLKANLANPTFTGTVNIPTLNVTTAVTLPTASIADNALSLNIPKLNVENTFSGLRVNGQAYFNTLAPAMPAPTLDAQGTNKLYVDTALNLKANLSNPTFTGTATIPTLSATNATFTNPPILSGANISNLSIPDSALSVNIPKLNSSSSNFTGGMSIRNATIGSENMAQINTITGNTNIGSSNTNDVVNYIGKHNFSNSATDAYKFNGLTCNGYSYFNTRPPECPIAPQNDNSLTNKYYVDQLAVNSRSQPFLYTWSFGVGMAGASIVNNSLSTSANATRTIYMHIPTESVALVFPFTVTFNYFHVYANQNQTVPATNNPVTSFQTTFCYIYSQLNNTLYKTREIGNTTTASSLTFSSNNVNYTYKPLEITAFEGATGKKGVMFKIGLPQMPNTASNGNYIMAFSSSLRIENSYSDDQLGTGRTTNDFIYPSTDSKNEQGSVYFSYVAV